MIAFVVDQTGYPEEMVDMDADLEADLGIDSIKKAQLLAELAETYQLEPDESISLDELTSLETILELVMQQLSAAAGTATAPPSASQPPASQPPAVAPASTPEGIPAAAATEELPGGPAAASPASLDTELLRQRMMDFVVEQTGYPPEMVEFDADLEADLGIDSIKKAQLLAELQEIYQFPTRDDLTLDDFPDLQSIESFVTEMCVASDDFTRAAR
jgi:acyl carrier protein